MNRAELHIVIDAEGKLQISGPIHDKMICYGLLESAKDAIREFGEQRKIVQPPPGLSLAKVV